MQSQYDYEYEDNVPKNCTTSESITGGTVEYSNGGAAGSLLIYHCSAGFEPYPISQKVCSSDGEWKPKVTRVKCEGNRSVFYSSYNYWQKYTTFLAYLHHRNWELGF